jgi:cytochrome c oxidase subunit 1
MWNLVSTAGAFTIALSILVFIINIVKSARAGAPAGLDPWDARTLEWTIPGPPPPHNFDVIPTVTARDELWHRKYAGGDEHGAPKRVQAGASADHDPRAAGTSHGTDEELAADPDVKTHGDGHAIHMPDPSYWPLVLAIGMPIAGWGVLFDSWVVIGLGILIIFLGAFGWVLEPGTEPSADHA